MSQVPGLDQSVSYFADLVKKGAIEVPIYQRTYSWNSEQITSLWDDIITTMEAGNNATTLFLGPTVFHIPSDEHMTRHLVDGQQRFTTISMMLAALRNRVRRIKGESAVVVALRLNNYLFQVDPMEEDSIDPDAELTLRLSKKDNDQFEALVRHDKKTGRNTMLRRGWAHTDKLIADYLQEMRRKRWGAKIAEIDEAEVAEFAEAATLKLAKGVAHVLSNHAALTVITARKPCDPLTVFESLNSKGLPLAQSDLIKNLLIQKVPEEKARVDVSDRWDNLAELLDKDLVRFLRHWYIARHEHITMGKLYACMEKLLTGKQDIKDHLAEWETLAPWYAALRTGTSPPTKDEAIRDAFRDYAMTGNQQGLPVLVAMIHRGTHKHLVPLIEILNATYVRLFVSGGQRGSIFEGEVDILCSAVREDDDGGIANLRETLRNLIFDHVGQIDPTKISLNRPGLRRYILGKLACEQQGQAYRLPPSSVLEVEHILPQKRLDNTYKEILDDEYKAQVDRLGNLTLILKADNQKLSNKPFEEKRIVFADYDGRNVTVHDDDGNEVKTRKDLRMTHDLAKYEEWGIQQITERARSLEELAEQAWPVP